MTVGWRWLCCEAFVRDDLNKRSLRRMAVLHPLKLVIDNYPEDQVEEMDAVNNPEDPRLPARAKFRSRKCSTSNRMISARRRRPNISACIPAMKSACATPISSNALVSHAIRFRRCDRSALHLRSGHPRRRCTRWTQGQIHHPLGLSPPCRQGRSATLRATLHS